MKLSIDWIVGSVIALILFFAFSFGLAMYRDYVPTTDWFDAQELVVPDFNVGIDPVIAYNRIIKQDVQGTWIVDVQKITEKGLVSSCIGKGEALYSTKKVLPLEGITLEWLVGKECHLNEGTYQVEVKWTFDIPDYGVKYETIKSNTFTVSL